MNKSSRLSDVDLDGFVEEVREDGLSWDPSAV